ncbi:MAG: glycosyltransferase [bacterium]
MNLGNAEINKLFLPEGKTYNENKAENINPANENNALSFMVNAINENSTVLDVGCAYGYVGEWLNKNKNCTIYGIDIDAEALKHVKSSGCYKDLFNIDLDYTDKFRKEFERFNALSEGLFDFIICADVLEHLKDPTRALEIISTKLKLSGQIIISLPNIAHLDIILNLLEGKFNYSDFGLLDNTHLRFFTKESFIEWINLANERFKEKGFKFDVKLIGTTKYSSDFLETVKIQYPKIYKIFLNSNDELLILQNIIVLTKVNKQTNVFEIYKLLENVNKSNVLSNISEDLDNSEQLKIELEQAKGELNQTIKKLTEELKAKDDELHQTVTQLEQTKTDSEQLKAELEQAKDELNMVYSSRSWRIARPLRTLMKYIKKTVRAIKREKVKFKINPINELKEIDGNGSNYESIGEDPYFYLEPVKNKFPKNYVKIYIGTANIIAPSALYFDVGNGFNENDKLLLFQYKNKGKMSGYAKIPDNIKAMRFDPQAQKGAFYIGKIYIQELSKIETGIRLLFLVIYEELKNINKLKSKILKASIDKDNLILKIKNKINKKLINNNSNYVALDYQNYIDKFEVQTIEIIEKNQKDIIGSLKSQPLISVIMPTYNTPHKLLQEAINSVINQMYPNWELCIADDASTTPHVKKSLEHYKKTDKRIKVIYRTENGHISKASNSALSLATGDYIALLDHDDMLHKTALLFVAKEINDYPEVKLIYSDEDKLNKEGVRTNPYFKCDFNPDLFLSQNMISHLGVYERSIVNEIGGFREGYEGSQDYDMALRFIEKIKYNEIRHIPRVLYHWRMAEGSTAIKVDNKSYSTMAARKAIQDHLDRLNIKAKVVCAPLSPDFNRVIYDIRQNPLVSLIIPTYNEHEVLKKCIKSILQKTAYKNYEIIIVNNNSNNKETLQYLNSINGISGINVIEYNKPFNYSAINNFTVKFAKGEILTLLNNDTEVINEDWLRELVSHSMRKEVGVVGAMLLYPDDTVQHAGVIIGLGGCAGHAFYKTNKNDPGYFSRAVILQNYSAVTGACFSIRKKIYEQVGGMDENLAIAFNDIDFCLKVAKLGYYNVYTPYALLYHHESKTRGCADTKEKQERFKKEIDYFTTQWKTIMENDPFYNPNLSNDGSFSFSIALHPRVKFPFKV